ncbi:hypothetical protein DFJ74DRAFT_685409 [Hyaloraphidium curvatum]|nr:hypothetical protein DFJ74DRAFT_685409 [Hyaloraphidium curvatum]
MAERTMALASWEDANGKRTWTPIAPFENASVPRHKLSWSIATAVTSSADGILFAIEPELVTLMVPDARDLRTGSNVAASPEDVLSAFFHNWTLKYCAAMDEKLAKRRRNCVLCPSPSTNVKYTLVDPSLGQGYLVAVPVCGHCTPQLEKMLKRELKAFATGAKDWAPGCMRCCRKPAPDGVVLRRCGRCKHAFHCSPTCQAEDLPLHKSNANAWPRSRLARSEPLTDVGRDGASLSDSALVAQRPCPRSTSSFPPFLSSGSEQRAPSSPTDSAPTRDRDSEMRSRRPKVRLPGCGPEVDKTQRRAEP